MANLRKHKIYYRSPGIYDWTPQSDKWFAWDARLFLWWVRHTAPDLDGVEFKIVKDDTWEVHHEPVKTRG
jgi:hypothetical protein